MEVTSLGSAWNANLWTSSRNNATNAWNSNSGNGNVNTNNVYNRYRALAAQVLEVPDLSDDILQDYLDAESICYSNKHSSIEANRIHYTLSEVYKLVQQVLANTWTQGTAIVFTISKPTYREIWASEYTDRILHHLVGSDLCDLTEIIHNENNNVSHGNRIGHSAYTAAKQIQYNMQLRPNGFVAKRDLSGFFMSINRKKVTDLILSRYHGDKADIIRKLIMHDPTLKCISRASKVEMLKIPNNKSLFHAKDGCGLPIGNYYSQLVANAYLSSVDALSKSNKWKDKIGYTRFVDDICVVADDIKIINKFFDEVENELNNLELLINKNKKYQQPVKHGVNFCGYTIYPNRLYISNRTVNNCIQKFNNAPIELNGAKKLVVILNSYYGFFSRCNAMRIQVRIAKKVKEKYGDLITISKRNNQLIFRILPKYRYKNISLKFMKDFANIA